MTDSSTDAWQAFRRVYWSLAVALAAVLVLLALMGFGPGGRNCKLAGSAAAQAPGTVAQGEPASCSAAALRDTSGPGAAANT